MTAETRPAYRLRQALHRTMLEARLAGRRLRGAHMRPSLFVIGAQKAGTTSLFGHLARHPQVLPPIVKEVHYFDVASARGEGWYGANFPRMDKARKRVEASGEKILTFDATPYYIFHPDVAGQIRRYAPDAKIIALLRDPVTRAWSHYWHEWSRGYEQLPPQAAFEAEPNRVPGAHERVGASAAARLAHQHFTYCARSEYDIQIRRWQGLFPSQQLLFLRSEDMFADPDPTLRQVTDFLAIDPFPSSLGRALNPGRYDVPPDDMAAWLATRLAPSIAATRALLGPNFTWT